MYHESILLGMPSHSHIAKSLLQLYKSKHIALQNGARLRRDMHLALQNGKEPVGYRPEWVKKSAVDVVKVMAILAKDFNEAYPGDRASVNDLIDVLELAIRMLDEAAGK